MAKKIETPKTAEVTYEFLFTGFSLTSLNAYYSGVNFKVRNKKTKTMRKLFGKEITMKNVLPMISYSIELQFNSRLDPSNTILMIKWFEDALQDKMRIPNDNKKFCKGLTIVPDLSLAKNTYKLILKGRINPHFNDESHSD